MQTGTEIFRLKAASGFPPIETRLMIGVKYHYHNAAYCRMSANLGSAKSRAGSLRDSLPVDWNRAWESQLIAPPEFFALLCVYCPGNTTCSLVHFRKRAVSQRGLSKPA